MQAMELCVVEDMLCTSKVLQEGMGEMDCLGEMESPLQGWLEGMDKKERRETL